MSRLREKISETFNASFERATQRLSAIASRDDTTFGTRAARSILKTVFSRIGGEHGLLVHAEEAYRGYFTAEGHEKKRQLQEFHDEDERELADIRSAVTNILLPKLTEQSRHLADEILKVCPDPFIFFRAQQAANMFIFGVHYYTTKLNGRLILNPDGSVNKGDESLISADAMGDDIMRVAGIPRDFNPLLKNQLASWVGHAVRDVPGLFYHYDACLDDSGNIVLIEVPDSTNALDVSINRWKESKLPASFIDITPK